MRSRTEGRLVGGATWRWASMANRARIVAKDFSDVREKRRMASAGPSVAERQAELLAFYDRFERFVESLCDAAQYGPNPHLEEVYVQEREWVARRYAALRPYVDAYLSPEEPDAFDRLLGPEDLSHFLADDDGLVIFRITSTRDALSHYAEHLRQLSTRKAP